MLKRGVGFHHSGLLPIVKEVVELLFYEGLIKARRGPLLGANGGEGPGSAADGEGRAAGRLHVEKHHACSSRVPLLAHMPAKGDGAVLAVLRSCPH